MILAALLSLLVRCEQLTACYQICDAKAVTSSNYEVCHLVERHQPTAAISCSSLQPTGVKTRVPHRQPASFPVKPLPPGNKIRLPVFETYFNRNKTCFRKIETCIYQFATCVYQFATYIYQFATYVYQIATYVHQFATLVRRHEIHFCAGLNHPCPSLSWGQAPFFG